MIKYIIISLFLLAHLFAGEFVVDADADNLVKFTSFALWEEFEGVTNNIDGYLYWEGDDMTKASELYFEVDLNSVETGNGKRDRDMQNNYLHTNRFPFTHFTGQVISVYDSTDDISKVEIEGIMFIHGVEQKRIINGIIFKSENGLKIVSNFEVNLTDFNIEIPSIMILKINEVIKLHLTFNVVK